MRREPLSCLEETGGLSGVVRAWVRWVRGRNGWVGQQLCAVSLFADGKALQVDLIA